MRKVMQEAEITRLLASSNVIGVVSEGNAI